MVTTVANYVFTTVASLSSDLNPEMTTKLSGSQKHVSKRGVKLKASVQDRLKINNANIWKIVNHEATSLEYTKKTTTKNEEENDLVDLVGSGKLVQNGLAYRQNFPICSYDIGASGNMSMETLMNHLQEIVLNHFKCVGLLGHGLGSTPEMYKRDLIWVTTKVQIVIHRYPSWGDVMQIDDWIVPSGKTRMRRDSVIRDFKTGEILVRASSNWVFMNKVTRKLCRIPKEVRDEMGPYMMDAKAPPILENDNKKTPKLDETTADCVFSGIKPIWSDLDINQHVNNAKYIGWILESVPSSILETKYLSRVTLEYRKECQRDDMLQSLTAVSNSFVGSSPSYELIECEHLLRLEDGSEVMKARSEWRPKVI